MTRFTDEHRDRVGVEPICRELSASRAAYYRMATGERSTRAIEDEVLIERMRVVHTKNYAAYGSRRI